MTQVLYMNYMNSKNFSYLVAQELFVTNQLVFYFQRNHFLSEKFSEKIDRFREAGLIEKLMSKYVDMRFLKLKLPQRPPSALTLPNLSAVFGLFIFGSTVSIVVAILEFLWIKYLKFKQPKNVITLIPFQA